MPENPRIISAIWKPIGGVNSEDNYASLDPSEVTDARNFLFENNEAKTRPGVSTLTFAAVSGFTVLRFADAIYTFGAGGSWYNFFYTSGNRLFYVMQAAPTTAVELTLANGHALSRTIDYFKAVSVNGAILFSNIFDSVSGGMIRWVPGDTNITSMPTAFSPLFVTGHLSRAVAAYPVGQSGEPQITVEYSKPGDETVWNTSPSIDGSGSVILADAPDSLTGLRTVNNVVVVMRETGIHLGFPTGVATPPFRWESYMRERIGLPSADSATIASDNNLVIWKGLEDVYMFDLSDIKPIGGKIRSQIIDATNGITYVGVITRLTKNGITRRRYNLVPTGLAGQKHFSMDLETGVWSIHTYGDDIAWAFEMIRAQKDLRFSYLFMTAAPTVQYWDDAVKCDMASYLVTGAQRVGDYSRDMSIERGLISARDYHDSKLVTLTASGTMGTTVNSVNAAQAVGLNNNSKWIRSWYNLRGSLGQDIQVRIDVPNGGKFATDHIQLQLSEQGVLRG